MLAKLDNLGWLDRMDLTAATADGNEDDLDFHDFDY